MKPFRRGSAAVLTALLALLGGLPAHAQPAATAPAPAAQPASPALAAPVPAVDQPQPAVDEPDSGRTSFIVSTTLASFSSGFVVMDLLDRESLRGGVASISATTAVGFLASLHLSRGRTITAATADAYSLGMLLGAGNGLLLSKPVGIHGATGHEGTELMALGALALGGTAGLVLGDRLQPTRGQVAVTSTLSLLGIASFALGYGIIQPDSGGGDLGYLVPAACLDAGAVAGFLVAPHIDWSVSRARMVSLGSFLGALGGFATGVLAFGGSADLEELSEGKSLNAWSATTLAGVWSGFGLSWYLTRGMRPDVRFAPASAGRPAPGPAATAMQILPTPLPGGGGFSVAGSF
jgi:hypothetical protein